MKTMKDLAREALAVQDACNLSGVAHGFARALGELRTLLPSAARTPSTSTPSRCCGPTRSRISPARRTSATPR